MVWKIQEYSQWGCYTRTAEKDTRIQTKTKSEETITTEVIEHNIWFKWGYAFTKTVDNSRLLKNSMKFKLLHSICPTFSMPFDRHIKHIKQRKTFNHTFQYFFMTMGGCSV